MAELFGFNISKKQKKVLSPSFVAPRDEDGAINAGGNSFFNVSFEGKFASNNQRILFYREMAGTDSITRAIDDIVEEAIVSDPHKGTVEIDLTDVDGISKSLKNKITDEFDTIVDLFDFNHFGSEMFREWYIDGKLYFHVVVNPANMNAGIVELRPINALYIKKVRKVLKKKVNNIDIVTGIEEYFLYDDPESEHHARGQAIKISKDSIVMATSGLKDNAGNVISYLQQAIKPFNQLRSLEDAVVIYRIARAPERRVFYIDVGNLPKTKAEEYIKSVVRNNQTKISYSATSGAIKENKHVMSVMEDLFLARRDGSRGTEVDTLAGATQLGEIDDLVYFQKKQYLALHLPMTRFDNDSSFVLGRSGEISREEIKFTKFIEKLRKTFARLFLSALKRQLLLKRIIVETDWDKIKSGIAINFATDSHFTELKNIEIMSNRIELLSNIDESVGKYFSMAWVKRNVLFQTDEEIEEIEKEIEQEAADGEEDGPEDPVPQDGEAGGPPPPTNAPASPANTQDAQQQSDGGAQQPPPPPPPQDAGNPPQ